MNLSKYMTFLALLSLVACGTFEVGIEHLPGTTATLPLPTSSPEAATATSPLPTAMISEALPTQTLEDTASPLQPDTSSAPQMVKIFLIAVDDHGQSGKQIGCGDSVVPVQVPIAPTQGVLKASLEALLALKDQYYGESGLYNALYQSDLHLESVVLNGGNAVVYLSGTLRIGRGMRSPKVQAQLEETVMQFSTVSSVTIYINGQLLSDVLSLKG